MQRAITSQEGLRADENAKSERMPFLALTVALLRRKPAILGAGGYLMRRFRPAADVAASRSDQCRQSGRPQAASAGPAR